MQYIFINEFLTLGIESLYKKSHKNPFEKHIIECLIDIYGLNSISEVYKNNDINGFEKLLKQYGMTSSNYDSFIKSTFDFEEYLKARQSDPSLKTEILYKIESILVMMFFYKSLHYKFSLEEVSHFENNLLNDFEIIKLHFNMSFDPNATRTFWNDKKNQLSKGDSVILNEIKPNYLDEFTYSKFGVNIETVKQMDYRMVIELNKYIENKLKVESYEIKEKKKWNNILTNTVITSGSGFVDGLMITSIIATEISIGLIYFFLHM